MLSLKLVRSLILGDSINDPLLLHHHHLHHAHAHAHPFLLFLPTQEIIMDIHSLATLARRIGMDFSPNPTLSHIIFSWPSSSSSSSSPPPPIHASLPFPSLSSASASHLRRFVHLSRGLFKLVFSTARDTQSTLSSSSLYARLTGSRIDSIECLAGILAGAGWVLFKTGEGVGVVYAFRKVDSKREMVGWSKGKFRVREVRLPALDFGNVPARVLHYIILMTDNLFYLA